MSDHLVSIIIPTYNRARLVQQAIESALAQTYRDFEIIVVDDGSTDDTRKVLVPYLQKGKIFYHFQPNAGHAAALNTGIRLARGQYVAFLDSDDQWLPEKLTRQMNLFHQNPRTVLVHTDIIFCNEQGQNLGTLFERTQPHRGDVLLPLFKENFISLSSTVVKKEPVVGAGLFDAKNYRTDDYDLWFRLAVDYPFDYVEAPLVKYLRHAHNLTNNKSINLWYLIRAYRKLLGNPKARQRIGRKRVIMKIIRVFWWWLKSFWRP